MGPYVMEKRFVGMVRELIIPVPKFLETENKFK